LIFSDISLILTDWSTIYVAKSIFASKTIFATPVFIHGKNVFSTNQQKPANRDNNTIEK